MKSQKKAERVFRRVRHAVSFKNEKFDVVCHCYDSASLPDKVEGINLMQAENLYRQKYGLPFPEEIVALRERYGLTPHRLSEILSMGPNTIKKYERGELPAPALGRMILSLEDSDVFASYLDLARNSLGSNEYEALKRRSEAVSDDPQLRVKSLLSSLCHAYNRPSELNGFRALDFNRLTSVISYLGSRMKLTMESLSRMLFYVDFAHYRTTCRSVTGLVYESTADCGIRVYCWETIVGMLGLCGLVHVHESVADGSGTPVYSTLLESVCPADGGVFSESELAVLEKAVAFFGGQTPAQQVAFSLKEPLWLKNHDTPEVLSYQPHAFFLEW